GRRESSTDTPAAPSERWTDSCSDGRNMHERPNEHLDARYFANIILCDVVHTTDHQAPSVAAPEEDMCQGIAVVFGHLHGLEDLEQDLEQLPSSVPTDESAREQWRIQDNVRGEVARPLERIPRVPGAVVRVG